MEIDVQDEEDEYADVADAEAGRLKSGLRGAAQILWKESGTGEKWAVVRVGPSPPFDVILVAHAAEQFAWVEEEN